MKILLIHNSHTSGSSSGDDVVVNNEIKLLRSKGHNVTVFSKNNTDFERLDPVRKIINSTQMLWSIENYLSLKKLIKKKKIDIVHVHTWFPLLSPSIYFAINASEIPVIQTLHDFRFFCPKAFFFRNGEICEECVHHSLYKAISYKCFQDSFIRSFFVSNILYLTRKLNIFDKICAFITFTEFGERKFSQLGISKEKIFIKPHFMFNDNDNLKNVYNKKGDKYFLYLGRLGEEKGITFLIDVWKFFPKIPLKIAGSGPLEEWVKKKVSDKKNIEFIGFVSRDEVKRLLKKALAVIVPSVWYETFGMVIMESYSAGTPVIASNIGALADIVKNEKTGFLFKSGGINDLIRKVRWLWEHDNKRRMMGVNARREFERRYTHDMNYKILMQIYQKAIEVTKA